MPDSQPQTIVIASGNKGKIAEFKTLLEPLGYTIKGLPDFPEAPEVVEDGRTFEENSLKKARETSAFLQVPVLADDSGLCVHALDDAPGVYSARYAGEQATDAENNAKLLREMEGMEQREARFVCVLSYVDAKMGTEHAVRGECEGMIQQEPSGEHGFGYDPLFYVPQLDKTFAEAAPDEKNQVSHRARAFMKMKDYLAAQIGKPSP
ncbi:XTP/dITP diphosphatase [Marinicrinis sediminis]|uniref:dITP/XTP pyrophosphatase n=1 Tax=Marinicrinis sediminis TaxID=1652465 RepID=A0ABW5R7G9_9BACL